MYPLKTTVKYIPGNLSASANTFTTVYLGNYVAGNFDEGVGSHCGVDIFPVVTHDDIYACMDGVVQMAENKPADGNCIVLKHDNVPDPLDMSKKTTLYSCHLHLSEMSVTVGQLVSEGDVIGKCGNTGNVTGSTGEHLHFQLDRKEAPFHPYWPFTFADSKAAGLGFFESVNKGLGLENAKKYTVNPLVYLDTIASFHDSTGDDSIVTPVVTPVAPVIKPNPTDSSVQGFSDVPSTHPYAKAINFLKSKNIIGGDNGKFSPDATVTRAELMKMVFGAAKIVLITSGPNYFSDIDPNSWQAPYANTAKANNVIGGYPDGTFKPNNPITRAEAFKIIINTFHPDTLDTVSFPVFDDVPVTDWSAPYANFAKINELIIFSDNTFKPNIPMNRGEVASAIYILLNTVQ